MDKLPKFIEKLTESVWALIPLALAVYIVYSLVKDVW